MSGSKRVYGSLLNPLRLAFWLLSHIMEWLNINVWERRSSSDMHTTLERNVRICGVSIRLYDKHTYHFADENYKEEK